MIRYKDLVEYIKTNHVNWNTDLFDVLKGFFEEYSLPQEPPTSHISIQPIQEEAIIFEHREFTEPSDGEYTNEDLLNLFST